jgi:hypothetical protein
MTSIGYSCFHIDRPDFILFHSPTLFVLGAGLPNRTTPCRTIAHCQAGTTPVTYWSTNARKPPSHPSNCQTAMGHYVGPHVTQGHSTVTRELPHYQPSSSALTSHRRCSQQTLGKRSSPSTYSSRCFGENWWASLLVIPTNYYGMLFSQLSHLKKLVDGLRIVVDTCPVFLQLGAS